MNETVRDESIRTQNRQRLVDFFASGAKSLHGFGRLGVEVEHIVVGADGTPIAFEAHEGLPGMRDVLDRLRTWYPDCSYNEDGELIALMGDEGSVTLEPSCQLEFSVAPFERVADVERAYAGFLRRALEVLAPAGATIIAAGYHPTRTSRQLSLIPKRRYEFMDGYFAAIGSHGDRMMRGSASTQVSVDFADEADAVRKMRVASALSPVLAAIADNTRVYEGEPNRTPIRRLALWREVDGLRSGTVPGVFEPGFDFGAYADWLLRTPPIFVTRPAASGPRSEALRAAFYSPAADVYADAPMDEADIEHLVSMFWPDVRLKRFVEIRPADCMPLEQVLGYTALIKGLFYSSASLDAVEGAIGVRDGVWPLTSADVDSAIHAIACQGLPGEVYGRTLEEWEELLFALASSALPEDERHYLGPIVSFARDKGWWGIREARSHIPER